jgi:hypothetical protein
VQVLSRAPITESEAGGVLHAVANRWVLSCGMAFEWSALRQHRGSHVACLVGLNPTMIREGRERSTRSASANLEGEVRGAHPRLESEWHPHGCVDRDLPPSANSGAPGVVGGSRFVPSRAFHSSFGWHFWPGLREQGELQIRRSSVRFVDWPPFYSSGKRMFDSFAARQLFRCGLLASQQRCRTQPTQVRFLPPDPIHEPWVVGIPVGL